MDKKFGDVDRTRSEEQRKAYEGTVGRGICPFCGPTDLLPEEIRSRMIRVGDYWRVWHNPHPYGTAHRYHFILAPIQHIEQPSELSPEARLEWFEMNDFLIKKFNLPGGGLVMRYGSHEYKGGSITHLHSHNQVPNLTTYSIAVFYEDEALTKFFRGE